MWNATKLQKQLFCIVTLQLSSRSWLGDYTVNHRMLTDTTHVWVNWIVQSHLPYQLIAGAPMCSFQWNLNGGYICHPDAGHRIKAILGEDEQLHVYRAARHLLTEGQYTEELAPRLAQAQISACSKTKFDC